jgi:acetyl esterase/lipase
MPRSVHHFEKKEQIRMHSHLRITHLMSVMLIAAILLGACGTPTSTPTLEPIVTPTRVATSIPATIAPTPISAPVLLSKSPELILAINKPFRTTTIPDHVVYTMTETNKVLLASELIYYSDPNLGDLTVDVYYPPSYNFESKLPIVILSHGYNDMPGDLDKDLQQHIDWAKLIAASGMIAVSARAGDAPVAHSYHVLDFLAANADALGIDMTRIGFWTCSGQGEPVFKTLEDKKQPYQNAFKSAVFLYSDLSSASPNNWPQQLSLFVAKAGEDKNIDGSAIDEFVSKARSSNLPTEYIELAGAPHAFDVYQNTQNTKDVVRQSLDFFKRTLLK